MTVEKFLTFGRHIMSFFSGISQVCKIQITPYTQKKYKIMCCPNPYIYPAYAPNQYSKYWARYYGQKTFTFNRFTKKRSRHQNQNTKYKNQLHYIGVSTLQVWEHMFTPFALIYFNIHFLYVYSKQKNKATDSVALFFIFL